MILLDYLDVTIFQKNAAAIEYHNTTIPKNKLKLVQLKIDFFSFYKTRLKP
jgi:hypothetical protein